ncbi:unnamed protein product [Musa acuminata subsp. malaccensis]|uniref:(wild Malaysian banana) hypothetical protein n=1 Tax=Musa acuminata subsp. malaccensis TaxID=214687 RepID=A0A804JGR9_MUSAM|nr:unnamed protein product [Musa acuminata subsp. malaccensis]
MWTTTRRGGGRWSCRNECKRRCSGDCKCLGIPYRKESPVPGTSAKVSTSSHSVYVKFVAGNNFESRGFGADVARFGSGRRGSLRDVPRARGVGPVRWSDRDGVTVSSGQGLVVRATDGTLGFAPAQRMNSLSVEKGTISELKNAVNDVSKAAHRTFQHSLEYAFLSVHLLHKGHINEDPPM